MIICDGRWDSVDYEGHGFLALFTSDERLASTQARAFRRSETTRQRLG